MRIYLILWPLFLVKEESYLIILINIKSKITNNKKVKLIDLQPNNISLNKIREIYFKIALKGKFKINIHFLKKIY